MIQIGVLLSQVGYRSYGEIAVAADELGFESVWLGEHLVLPLDVRGRLTPEEDHPPISSSAPVLGVTEELAFLAARTSRIRLGTFVYLLGLRHPFASARAFTTLDVLSQGRVEVGIGAGWLRTEWEAAGADFDARGRCLEEALTVCRRLWTSAEVSHQGEFFRFPPVAFEPKPVQASLPISIGGESPTALRRAARLAQGWLGMEHTPDSAARQVEKLRASERQVDRDGPLTKVTVVGELSADQPPEVWSSAGVDRLIVHPWRRTADSVDSLERLATDFLS